MASRERLSEASRAIAPGRQPRDSTASAPKAGMLRMRHVDEDPCQISTAEGHTEAWKLDEHELMHMLRDGEGVVRGQNVTDKK